MFEYLRGTLVERTPTHVVIECGGVGYRVMISLHTERVLQTVDTVQKLYITELIREDSHTLFGFATLAERHLFGLLTGVSGIGATTAQLLLSAMTPEQIRGAILGENEAAFSKVKGIGIKTAKRLIVELKDKVVKEGGAIDLLPTTTKQGFASPVSEEALMALEVLGFSKAHAQKAVDSAIKQDAQAALDVNNLVRIALQLLSS
jgi:Holliday junction DNA helicase RuvA